MYVSVDLLHRLSLMSDVCMGYASSVCWELMKIFSEMRHSEQRYLSPKALYYAFTRCFPFFGGHTQQDAAECMQLLLHRLTSELKQASTHHIQRNGGGSHDIDGTNNNKNDSNSSTQDTNPEGGYNHKSSINTTASSSGEYRPTFTQKRDSITTSII